jgi:hypothetical protein
MPRKPSVSMQYGMQNAQNSVMDDICIINRATMITGTYGMENVYVTGTPNVCGFFFTNGQINQRGQVSLVDYDVVLRLPAWTPVSLDDRIVLLQKGTIQVSGTFAPSELPEIGMSAVVVHLKRTT